jgi:3-methyladenine DNA glycosylase AlkD
MIAEIKRELKKLADPIRAKASLRYFKTGKGEYGEGDKFLGISCPNMRKIAKQFNDSPISEIQEMLTSPYHEFRQVALFILVNKFQKVDKTKQKEIYNFYLSQTDRINNWDLVDLSAHKIVGAYLFERDKNILYKLAKSKNIWDRRIAIVATFYFISKGRLDDTFKIAERLLKDDHDLIHKAVGWALREAGKRDRARLVKFLNENRLKMSRTTLRYAIEKFSPAERKKCLSKPHDLLTISTMVPLS